MRNEEFMIVMKDMIKEIQSLVRLQNKQAEFYEGLLNKGLMFEKTVSKFAQSSAAIYVPRRLVGKTFKVVLVPIAESDQYIVLPKRDSKLTQEKVEVFEKEEKEKRKVLDGLG